MSTPDRNIFFKPLTSHMFLYHVNGFNQSESRRNYFRAKITTIGVDQSKVYKIFWKMSGFDQAEIYVSDPYRSDEAPDEIETNRRASQRKFKQFLREYHEGTFAYKYR